MRVVICIKGELAQEMFCDRGSVYEGCSEFFFFFFNVFSFLSFTFTSCILVFDHLTYIVLIFGLQVLMYVIHLSLHVLFLFPLYAHNSYILYAIYYFYFTHFCLKCFKNTGCQSILAINSLLTKFFKSLCQDRFYCIQQVSMS